MTFYDFIEIGTSDFDTLIQKANNDTRGISIEPIKLYLDRLPNPKNCIKENIAISDRNGEIKMYYIPTNKIIQYNLPKWTRGCNSVNIAHPTMKNLLLKRNLNPDEIFVVDTVPVCELIKIINKYNVDGIYFLKIDTEGHDTIILNNFLNSINDNKLLPHKIQLETNVLSNSNDTNQLLNRLTNIGYRICDVLSQDTILELNINSLKNREHFTGTIFGYYLSKYPENYNPKNPPHLNTLESAKEYCINNKCGGVTYQYKRYEVRKGDKLIPCNDKKLSSWILI